MRKNTLRLCCAAAAVLFVLPINSWAQKVNAGDEQFMKEAATGGLAEAELGRLAARKAKNAQVRAFGNRMVRDHSKANLQLKALARRKHVVLPTMPAEEQKTEKANLSKLSGADFDREYMRLMVEDHDKDVSAFQQKSGDAGDADLKAWVTKTLPTLQEHQRMAHEIQGKL